MPQTDIQFVQFPSLVELFLANVITGCCTVLVETVNSYKNGAIVDI